MIVWWVACFGLAMSLLLALMSVIIKNSVRAVLSLIGAFSFASVVAVLFGASFAAMILMTVYVGAVAVLFLFVIMMIDSVPEKSTKGEHRPLALIALIIFFIIVAISVDFMPDPLPAVQPVAISPTSVGLVMYTDHAASFQLAGLMLVAAMVGAIVITLRSRKIGKSQDITSQVLRHEKDALFLVKIAPNAKLTDYNGDNKV